MASETSEGHSPVIVCAGWVGLTAAAFFNQPGARIAPVGQNRVIGLAPIIASRESNMPLSDLVDHVVYIADRIGVDHVALGSDFDGATMPDELGDVSGLPKLVTALRSSGFNEEELIKIAHENWLRVLRMTWKA